ncbi:MAG: hypothetical protein K0S16_2159 [Moraxellaceae bacterium]|nr:hypothetical protein [Moraxellaceae bacterium]
MNGNRWILASLVLVAVAVIVAGRWLWSGEGDTVVAEEQPTVLRPIGDTRLPELPPSGEVVATAPAATDVPLPPLPESTVDAAQSMAAAMERSS